MSAHTPGRLRYEHGLLLSEGSPEEMAEIPFYRDGVHDHDARRLVACWNACEGLSTEALEKEPQMKNWVKAYLDRTTQRDELLAAAQDTLAKNMHLADGDNCTLIDLKRAVERITRVAV